MIYSSFKYIYPPYPKTKLPLGSLVFFEKMNKFFAEIKLNGSSMEIYTKGEKIITYNRTKKIMSHKMKNSELLNLYKEKGWMVLCGELMNKNQKDENDEYWNNKYVITDILVYNGLYLLGTTFQERYKLLKELYPDNLVKKYLHQISENCFRIDFIKKDFKNIYNEITKYNMYEGLVLKRKDGKLENGTSINNNTRTQLKCRKSTKNYNF